MTNEEKLENWIDSNKTVVLNFLTDLLKIPSVTGEEANIQKYIAKTLRELEMNVDVFEPDLEKLRMHPAFVEPQQNYENRPNVVGTLKGIGSGKSILFNGHIDVIPDGAPDNWIHDPWSGDLEEGKIYGRGASDMKSGVAAMTMAIKAIKECGIELKGDVIAEYVVDEELTGNGTLDCVIKGYKADAGICCETSSMCIQPGSIGRIWFEIRVKGKAAGIQKRYEGVNAIELGYLVQQAVVEFEKTRTSVITHHLYPDIIASIPCMIGQFESGTYASAFPDACMMKGSMATVPGEISSEVKKEFVDFVTKTVAKQNKWFEINPPEIIFTGYYAEPSEIPIDTPIVKELCKQYENVTNTKPVISGRQGAADIRHLNKYGNTPTVIFGPGLTDQMHANNEWVYEDDYYKAVKILAKTILSWCNLEK